MRIVLVHAPVERIIEEYDAPAYPHLGLACLATYARRKGFDVAVIDAKFERLTLPSLLTRIKALGGERLVIGLTAMTHDITRNAFVAGEFKRHFPGVTVLIGGVHVSALPRQTFQEFPIFDIGVIGEGEVTFIELLSALRDGGSLSAVRGLVYREGPEVKLSEGRGWIDDLDVVGYPDWDLFPPAQEYPVNIGRGCPVPCIFCMRASGTKSRFRSAANILEELDLLNRKYKPQYVRFFGDDFAADKVLTHTILEGLSRIKPVFKWCAGMRVSNIDKSILQAMKRAGCEHFEIGVESGNMDILKAIRKGIALEKVEEAVRLAKEVRLDCWCYFILGHPHETEKTALDTINILCKLNPTQAAVGIMVPYPGTEIWNMAVKGEGGYKLLSHDWQDYNKQLGDALELEHLSRRQLECLQMRAYVMLFLSNFRFLDFLRFCWRYRREAYFFLRHYLTRLFNPNRLQ